MFAVAVGGVGVPDREYHQCIVVDVEEDEVVRRGLLYRDLPDWAVESSVPHDLDIGMTEPGVTDRLNLVPDLAPCRVRYGGDIVLPGRRRKPPLSQSIPL